MSSPLIPRHPVVILAHGLGSRLAAVARGLHKTTEAVGGRPLLWWLLYEIEAAGLTGHTVLSLRQDDPAVRPVLASFPWPVEVRFRQPGGYLPDVYRISREYGPRFTVVEADTITLPGMLRTFLLSAEQIGGEADLCVGVAPVAANPGRRAHRTRVDRRHELDRPAHRAGAAGRLALA
jgi:dTDP-glucose pyrophosphorylase